MNRILIATVGGIIAGAIGAALWAGVAFALHRELGILAWGLGALVGAGVAAGAKGEVGFHTGLLAAIISIASICAGKYAVVNTVVDDAVASTVTDVADHFGEDQAKIYLARQLVTQQVEEGKTLEWPAGMNANDARNREDFPSAIVNDVEARWNAMDQQARTTYTNSARENVVSTLGQRVEEVKADAFLTTFSLFDILFFILAVGTSFRLGASGFDS